MNQERRAELLAIVNHAADSHKQWVESGDARMLPEDDLYQRFQEIADQAKVIYRPRAEPLEQLILGFAPHWSAFVAAQQSTADLTMLPAPEFWEAWEDLHNSALQTTLPKLKRVETIAQLLKENVPRWQICKIYGFVQVDASPDFAKLEEEIETPGKHTGPGTGWVAPVNIDIQSKIDQVRIDAEQISRKREAKVRSATTPAPETIESLLALGSAGTPISATQIARMKKMTVDEVLAYCDQRNLPRPPIDYQAMLLAPGMHDPAVSAERRSQMELLGRDTSPQNAPVGDAPPEGDDDDGPTPSGIDLDSLPPEEANQIREACQYYDSGMDITEIGQSMGIHGNKVRSLLTKAGYDLNKPVGASS